MRRLSVDERLERAASIANIAMLRTYTKPSHIRIESINWLTFLLESEVRSIPLEDARNRKQILDQLDINRSILAPIRRLPVELLSEIFFRVQRSYPLRALQAATTISHVCSTWRDIAHGHAALWTTVVVETLDDFDNYRELFLPLAKSMLLELRCDNREILGDLWDCVAPYAPRWRRITLVAGLDMLPELKVLYMDNLERLVVDAYDAPMSANLSALDFVIAPHLRHLALTLDALQSERQLHVPVSRTLTSLEITTESPFPVSFTLPLLQACASTLKSLTLKVRYPLEGPEGSYPTSTSDVFLMKALKFLSLVDPACALLDHIAAPLVDELILSNVPEYGTRALSGFLTRSHSSRSLLRLRVYIVKEREISAWIPCIKLMHSLVDFHFDELLSSEEFLRLLIRHADKPPILPSLKRIAISNIYYDHIELRGLIREMCKSRSRMTTIRGHRASVTLSWFTY